eukprot:3375779-Rhodomonas_salina.1
MEVGMLIGVNWQKVQRRSGLVLTRCDGGTGAAGSGRTHTALVSAVLGLGGAGPLERGRRRLARRWRGGMGQGRGGLVEAREGGSGGGRRERAGRRARGGRGRS